MDMSVPQGVSTVWLDKPEDLWALEAEWQDLAERTDAEVYMRPAWLRVWWDHFGSGRVLGCLTIRKGRTASRVAAFLHRTALDWPGSPALRPAGGDRSALHYLAVAA